MYITPIHVNALLEIYWDELGIFILPETGNQNGHRKSQIRQYQGNIMRPDQFYTREPFQRNNIPQSGSRSLGVEIVIYFF
jgi:hypothetical protein